MNKKYEFTGETKEFNGRILRRIRRIEDDLVGGWIESEENLSQGGNCFVHDEGMVYGNAKICGNAIVFSYATVYDNAKVYDDAWIYGNAEVFGNARVFGDTAVFGNVKVFSYAEIYGCARVYDNARVYGNARVHGNAVIYGGAEICGNARVRDCARVYGSAIVHNGEIIGRVSQLYKDIFQHQCEKRVLTAILTEDDKILYTIGCQSNITKEQFLDRIYNTDGGLENNPHREEYLRLIPAIEMYFGK